MTKNKKSIVIFLAAAVGAPLLLLMLVGAVAIAYFVLANSPDKNPSNEGGGGISLNCDRYLDVIQPIVDRWDDANALASTTSRIALSGPLGDLQSIRREAVALTVPSCADEAHTHLVAYMNATIDGYLAFASQDDVAVRAYFDTAETLQDGFLAELEKFE